MRTVELAKAAAAAEALRLRLLARRQALRAAYGVGAAVFAIAVLVSLHVVLWNLLAGWVTPVQASLIVLALDVVVAAVLGFMASRNAPATLENEAKQIRQQALIEMRTSMTFMGMMAETMGAVVRSRRLGGVRRRRGGMFAEMASRLIGR